MPAPDPALAARFAADLDTALRRAFAADERIALAVSGGPDSMAMLALASAAFPGRVLAATVDHGLRLESAEEAVMVARHCAAIGMPHATLPLAAPPASGNRHDWARRERYAVLGRWAVEGGASVLATAHHADDQAETFLMRAARGSGLAGLSGVRAQREVEVELPGDRAPRSLAIVRPLLGWRRTELRSLVETAGVPFADDPSNADPRFDRARFRDWIARASWLDIANIAESARLLTDTETDLARLTDLLRRERSQPSDAGESVIDMTGLPRNIRRRIARLAIDEVLRSLGADGTDPPAHIEPLLDALDSGKSATQGPVLASAKGAIWHFRAAPPRRSH